jgi:hypothetical protein
VRLTRHSLRKARQLRKYDITALHSLKKQTNSSQRV